MPAGAQTRLVLAGSYRPPLDGTGATVDKIVLHHVATATISSLLRKIAQALAQEHPPSPIHEPCRPMPGSQACSKGLRKGRSAPAPVTHGQHRG
jgi:hypothetical protein